MYGQRNDSMKSNSAQKIRILIVDDNSFYVGLLLEAFSAYDVFEILPPISDGVEAQELVYNKQIDCMVLDLITQNIDGLTLLTRLRLEPPLHMPSIIINTLIDDQSIIDKALELGASYYLIKAKGNPMAQVESVVARVLDIKKVKPDRSEVTAAPTLMLENYISGVLKEIGVPPHLLGYKYLRQILLITMHNPNIHRSITTKLYPAVALVFETTPERVERSIRHAIEVAWDKGRLDVLEKYFGYTIKENKGKPTNGEFIAMVSDSIALSLNRVRGGGNIRF